MAPLPLKTKYVIKSESNVNRATQGRKQGRTMDRTTVKITGNNEAAIKDNNQKITRYPLTEIFTSQQRLFITKQLLFITKQLLFITKQLLIVAIYISSPNVDTVPG